MSAASAYAAAGQPGALAAAVGWVQELLTGGLATSLAVLAIAGIGLAMLLGEIPLRQGVRVVMGCFILFGAPLIARGLMDLAHGVGSDAAAPSVAPVMVPTPPAVQKPKPFDPYAGASVPG